MLAESGCAVCWDATVLRLLPTTPFLLLSELAYDLDVDDNSANKQLLNQQSKDSAMVPSSDPGSTAPRPSPAAASALILLPLLGRWP